MITRATLSTIEQGLPKYRSMLAGNAAFDPGAFISIATSTPSGSSTLTFSAIPQTYQHLQIRANALGTTTTVYLRINGSSAASYTQHRLFGDGSAVSAGGFSTQTEIQNIVRAQATNPGVAIVDILNYTSTTQNPVVSVLRGEDNNGSGNLYLVSGMFVGTGAITSLTFTTTANFAAGTQFSLYGIKGA